MVWGMLLSTTKKLNPLLRQRQADRKQTARDFRSVPQGDTKLLATYAAEKLEAIIKNPRLSGSAKQRLLRQIEAEIVESLEQQSPS